MSLYFGKYIFKLHISTPFFVTPIFVGVRIWFDKIWFYYGLCSIARLMFNTRGQIIINASIKTGGAFCVIFIWQFINVCKNYATNYKKGVLIWSSRGSANQTLIISEQEMKSRKNNKINKNLSDLIFTV